MKTSFLISTVTAALLAGTSLVSAQNTSADPKQDQKAMPTVQMKSQDKPGQAVQEKAVPDKSAQEKAMPENKGAKDKAAQEKAQDKAKDAKPTAQQSAPAKSTTGQNSQRQTDPATQQPAGQQPKATQGQASGSSVQGKTQAQSPASAANTSVSLTTEQKATIRQSVWGARNAPKAANVNFSITVGTAVPRSVHVVSVPEPLFRIHPAWRGNMYFIVGDEIIVIDRRTHEIIAVLPV